ncbi:MAG: site-2 protease family protein [Deltaproteobacteria bacterium]|nr:site-2 protease family protein [Deltaproteobacteria bacterium]
MAVDQNMDSSPNVAVDLKNDLIPQLKSIGSNQSKFGSLGLLIVTVILFFSAGIISIKWQDILILIGVLFFHELGHLAAMKLLKYNDVKMFFIPFVGAAVSGKNRNETAAKSCIVSLMGPFPGIIAGIALYILFTLTKNYYVFKAAQMMLLLNALNFLPIMPLDGGRYIDVLFINRKYFRFFFALMGAAIFFLLAALAKDIIIGLLGVVTLYIAFANFKLHGISNDLKSEGITAASVDELMENESAMQVVVDKLKDRYPRLFTPKLIYQGIYNQLTAIVDTIKFVPAKVLSKIVLLAMYLVMVSVSVIAAFSLIAINYREVPRVERIDGKQIVIVERHTFGKKNNECPINDDLYYHGKGKVFGMNGLLSADTFYYENGYRTGEWIIFGNSGNPIEKRTYNRGQLLSLSKLEGGNWKTTAYKDLSFLRRCAEDIQQLSQPFKSNHRQFVN